MVTSPGGKYLSPLNLSKTFFFGSESFFPQQATGVCVLRKHHFLNNVRSIPITRGNQPWKLRHQQLCILSKEPCQMNTVTSPVQIKRWGPSNHMVSCYTHIDWLMSHLPRSLCVFWFVYFSMSLNLSLILD